LLGFQAVAIRAGFEPHPTGVSTQRPQNTRGGVIRGLAQCDTYGFDWRDNETLVLQRGDELEMISVRRLWQ
jgi:hypothetical protein